MKNKFLLFIFIVLVFISIGYCGSIMELILFKKAHLQWEKKNYVLSEKLYEQCLEIDSKNKKFLYRYLLSKINQNKCIEVLSFFDNLEINKPGLKLHQLKRNARTQLFMNTEKIDSTIKANLSKTLNSDLVSFEVIPDVIASRNDEIVKIIFNVQKFNKYPINICVHFEKIGYPYYANFIKTDKNKKLWEIKFSIKKEFSGVKLELPVYVFYSKKDFYYYNLKIILPSRNIKVKGLSYTNELKYLDRKTLMLSRGKVKFKDFKISVKKQTINNQNLDKGKKFEIGTNYFVWIVARSDKKVKVKVSKRKEGIKDGKLIGYFHVGPAGLILEHSVITNDNLDGNTLALGIALPGMVQVGNFAMDIYECSMFEDKVVSRYGEKPLIFIHQEKARLLAESVGKRLPTNAEWFFCAQTCCEPTDLFYQGNGKEYANIWPFSIPFNSKDHDGIVNNPHDQNGANLSGGTLTGTCPLDINMYGNYDMIGN
ncbi:hypothetical protein KAJ27_01915, partial [bacterium]|nr:hypothetical protein [bacterium]